MRGLLSIPPFDRCRRIILLTLTISALLGLKSAGATVTDLAGGDLLCGTDITSDPEGRTTSLTCNNGDALSGTFINVGMFRVEAGATVLVAGGVPLAIYSSTIDVEGFMDGIGAGRAGGSGGPVGAAGKNGRGSGFGHLGSIAQAGGAGGDGGIGGNGGAAAGSGTGGAGGSSTGTISVSTPPMSPNSLDMGGGGGGGGGCTSACGATGAGGAGGSGGGSIYLEANSMTIGAGGIIDVSGDVGIDGFNPTPGGGNPDGPGAGGGGAGGMLALRITRAITVTAGATLNANGGTGGAAFGTGVAGCGNPTSHSGGGGGGGRIKTFYQTPPNFTQLTISTAAGAAGTSDGTGCADGANGSVGSQFFGIVASSSTGLGASQVNITSITWNWAAPTSFGNAASTSQRYRLFVFVSTAVAPPTSDSLRISSVTSASTNLNETGLTPNTLYSRVLTAYTDWGDSLPSNMASSATLASIPLAASPAFTGVSDTTLTLNWTAGAPANPSYTSYEVDRSTDPAFAVGISSFQLVALSSSPVSLTPNTTYFFKVRAMNLNGVTTPFTTTLSTVTSASAPSSPAFSAVNITSAVFAWSGGANPPSTKYLVQVSTDNFLSLAVTSTTLNTSATFFNLTPGLLYFFKAASINSVLMQSAFTTALSTTPGNLSDTTLPSVPGTPQTDRQYSYDGNAVFNWAAAQSPIGILDYNLLVGSTPGGSDFFSGNTTNPSFSASGLASGRTYYASVRARSNAGVYGPFSNASAGVPVFITSQAPLISKPYSWPNPADPQNGPINIGFSLGAPATVVLKIFTLQGNLAYQESRLFGSGNQVWLWNGRNGIGSVVEPGGYVCVMEKHYSGSTEIQKFKIAIRY